MSVRLEIGKYFSTQFHGNLVLSSPALHALNPPLTRNSSVPCLVSQRRPVSSPQSLKKSTIVASSMLYDRLPANSLRQPSGFSVFSRRGGSLPAVPPFL
jgi:hypothetical protein